MDEDQYMEYGLLALQIFLGIARAAGLDAEQRLALYTATDSEYLEMTRKPLPSVDG
jgi:hypothetical protein